MADVVHVSPYKNTSTGLTILSSGLVSQRFGGATLIKHPHFHISACRSIYQEIKSLVREKQYTNCSLFTWIAPYLLGGVREASFDRSFRLADKIEPAENTHNDSHTIMQYITMSRVLVTSQALSQLFQQIPFVMKRGRQDNRLITA